MMQTKHHEKDYINDIKESQHTLHTTQLIFSEGIKKSIKSGSMSLT